MDLLSEKSYSNKTTTSAETELNNRNKDEVSKKLAAYYNHVIYNRRTVKERPIKRYQTRLVENGNSLPGGYPPHNTNNNKNLIINDGHDQELRRTRQKIEFKTQSTLTIKTRVDDSNSNHATCSRNVPRNEVDPKSTYVKLSNKYEAFQNTDQPVYVEKTTYCRPSTDTYNQEFINKTMERTARLQGLVRRLVLAREREKQIVAWNNYINDLKNKHRYNESRTIPTYMTDNPTAELIDDYYNTRFTWQRSNPCQNLLQDLYGASDSTDLEHQKCFRGHTPLNFRPNTYENDRYSIPTSSKGRLMVLNRQIPKYKSQNQSSNRPTSKNFHGTPILIDREERCPIRPFFKRTQSSKYFDLKKPSVNENLSAKTDLDPFKDRFKNINENSTEETMKDKYNKVNDNVQRLKQKVMGAQNEVKCCSLNSIENKLNILIHSINNFIVEIKSQRVPTSIKCKAVQLSSVSSLINTSKSDTFGLLRNKRIVCGLVQERPRSTLTFNEEKQHDTLDQILSEEMLKSDKFKRDIADILNKSGSDRPSLRIMFDIPTKERATEITDSLCKSRLNGVVVEEINSQDKCMTIAVNTDPLGLLALLRVSTEAVKQILSYMPQIDYYSYLSRLPIPQMSRNEVTHFVCNICGASFGRPSQLSDHIQAHNLGNSRDCCVCRHVLDMQRHKAGLFSCRHCGQRFTRAYCRELHEQQCGRKLGRSPDVKPSLLILR